MTDPEHEDKVRFYRGADGAYRWQLCAAGNHEVIAASTEGYVSRSDAVANYERVTGRAAPRGTSIKLPAGKYSEAQLRAILADPEKWQESLG